MIEPLPPRKLTPGARREWQRVCPLLVELGVAAEIDATLLAAYCESWAMYDHALTCLAKDGWVRELPSGYSCPSAWVAIKNKEALNIMRYADALGIGPAARMKVKSNAPTGDKDKERFFRAKTG